MPIRDATPEVCARLAMSLGIDTNEQAVTAGDLLDQNRDQLEQSAILLASDFAFRSAVGTNDTATIMSVLTNHGARASAGVIRSWPTGDPGSRVPRISSVRGCVATVIVDSFCHWPSRP
mgnify:CR=1 FL=1